MSTSLILFNIILEVLANTIRKTDIKVQHKRQLYRKGRTECYHCLCRKIYGIYIKLLKLMNKLNKLTGYEICTSKPNLFILISIYFLLKYSFVEV